MGVKPVQQVGPVLLQLFGYPDHGVQPTVGDPEVLAFQEVLGQQGRKGPELLKREFHLKWVSTSFSSPLRVVGAAPELMVGYRVQLHGLLEETIEQEPACPGGAAIEPEGELVEVVLEVGVAAEPVNTDETLGPR